MTAPTTRPGWIRHLAIAVGAWLLASLGLPLIGITLDPVLTLTLTVSAVVLAEVLSQAAAAADSAQWSAPMAARPGLGRGSDHSTAALATRLREIDGAGPGSRTHLAARIREELAQATRAGLERRYGTASPDDPRVADRLGTDPDLAAALSGHLTDRDLTTTDTIARLLTRIEEL